MSNSGKKRLREANLRRALWAPVIAGMTIFTGFFGGLVMWSAFAPLSGAVIAGGAIAPEGATRVVQHLEGGIIEQILVKEGDRVVQGTPLIRLRDVKARTQHDILQSQAYQLELAHARLMAEQRGDSQWTPGSMPSDAGQIEAVEVQMKLFDLTVGRFTKKRRC